MSDKIGRKIEAPLKSRDQVEAAPSRAKFQESFPSVWEFLSIPRDFGEKHKTGCITLFADGVKIKLCVNDRALRQSAFVSGSTLMQALARVDRGLLEGSLTWNKSGYQRRERKTVNRRTPLLDA